MKKQIATTLLVFLCTASALAQSESYQDLKDVFRDEPEVHSFAVNGFVCRLVLGMAGEWEFKEAIRDVRHLRLMVIPAEAFRAQGLSVGGFKRHLRNDGFEELSTIRDKGDLVSIYLQSSGNKKNTYFVLVEERDEVVAIELKGHIDPAVLMDRNGTIAKM